MNAVAKELREQATNFDFMRGCLDQNSGAARQLESCAGMFRRRADELELVPDRETMTIDSPQDDFRLLLSTEPETVPLEIVKAHIQSFAGQVSCHGVSYTEIFMLGGKVFTAVESVEDFKRRFQIAKPLTVIAETDQ